MTEGFAFEVGHEVVCFDNILQASVRGVVVAIDAPQKLCEVRIVIDDERIAVVRTTFELIEALNS